MSVPPIPPYYTTPGLPAASGSDLRTGTSTTTAVTPGAVYAAAGFVTLTDGGTITPDFGAGSNFTVTLGGNRTLANPTNPKEGQSGVIEVVQDATGTRTLSYGANWKFAGGAPTLSTAANTKDQIAYICRSTSLIEAVLNKAFA